MLFIDGSNFYYALKKYAGRLDIDLFKLSNKLCGSRKLIRTYYYNSAVKQDDDQEKYQKQQVFFDQLKFVPYLDVRLGRLETRHADDGSKYYVEKGVDINIAVDMLRYAYNNSYDTAVLITGDGDFVSAVKAVQDLGKHVEHAYFEAARSHHLRKATDKFLPLDGDYLKDCLLDQKHHE